MPTAHRQEYIRRAARAGFEEHRRATGVNVQQQLQLGEVLLEQAEAQAQHLTACREQGLLDSELVDAPRVRSPRRGA